jgi:hypothetical protein
MRRLLPVLLMVLTSLVTFAGPAAACSCALLEPKQMLEFAPTAFVGTLTGSIPAPGGDLALTFEVETVLAGQVPAEVMVLSAANSAACGIEAAIGTRLGVFASDENGSLRTGLCSTMDPDAAIAVLGPGSAPSGTPTADQPFDWQAVWLGGAGLVLVGGAVALTRRSS